MTDISLYRPGVGGHVRGHTLDPGRSWPSLVHLGPGLEHPPTLGQSVAEVGDPVHGHLLDGLQPRPLDRARVSVIRTRVDSVRDT